MRILIGVVGMVRVFEDGCLGKEGDGTVGTVA